MGDANGGFSCGELRLNFLYPDPETVSNANSYTYAETVSNANSYTYAETVSNANSHPYAETIPNAGFQRHAIVECESPDRQ
jgi:hypothetical protein